MGRVVEKLLIAILLFSPISYVSGIPLNRFDLVFFQVSMIGLAVAWLWSFGRLQLVAPILVLMLAGIVSFSLSNFNIFVTSNLINLFLFCLGVLIVRQGLFELKIKRKWLVQAIFIAASINIFVLVVQKLGWQIAIVSTYDEHGGLMGNAPRLAAFLTIISPFAFRYCTPLFIASFLVGIWIKELLLPLMCLVVWFWNCENKWRWLIAIVSLLGVIVLKDAILHSLIIRFEVWVPTIEAILQKPLFGYGLGIFPFISNQIVPLVGREADNTFSSILNILFSFGVVGGIALIWYALKVFIKNFTNRPEAMAILAVFILSTVEYPLEIVRLWILLVVILGMFLTRVNQGGCNES